MPKKIIKVRNIILPIIFLIGICILLIQLQNKTTKDSVHISCSHTTRPVVEKIIRTYKEKYNQPIFIEYSESEIDINNILSGKYDLVFTTKSIKNDRNSLLGKTTIGFDALVMVVNPKNPVNEVNQQSILDIYTKKVKSWKEINGWNEPILISSEKTGSNSANLFEQYSGLKIPGNPKKGPNGYISEDTHIANSALESIGFVGRIPGAIGFTSREAAMYSKHQGLPLKILALDGIRPDEENIINDKYPIKTELNIIYRKNNSKINDFIDFILSNDGQKLIKKQNLIPVK